jgi:thioredoxin 1
MKQLLLLVLGWVALLPVRAAVPPGWSTNLAATLAAAERSAPPQPLLVYFTASWCAPCQMMARTTLTNDTVRETLEGFKRVALDIDEHGPVAERYEIRAVPTFLILMPSGEPVVTTTGYQDAGTFVAWLTNGISEVTAALTRKTEVERKLAEVDEWLKGNDAATLRRAAGELAELCAERSEKIWKPALERLTALARRDPLYVLDLLNHPRLVVRIQTANLLRTQLGEGFAVDPWSNAGARTNAIAPWREKLAAHQP